MPSYDILNEKGNAGKRLIPILFCKCKQINARNVFALHARDVYLLGVTRYVSPYVEGLKRRVENYRMSSSVVKVFLNNMLGTYTVCLHLT